MAQQRVALITGTSAGIGLHTALGLANHNIHVVATMRDLERSDQLQQAAQSAGVSLDIRQLDVVDFQGATTCVADVMRDLGQIDILINNAGQGQEGTLEELSMEDLQRQFDVNFFGVANLTKLVLPHMRHARTGRIISLSSIAGGLGQPFNDAYCASKFALEGLMQSLAIVVNEFGIDVVVVEPGPVATEFVEKLHEHSDGDDDDPYARARTAFAAISAGGFANAQSAEDAAAVVIEAALGDHPPFRMQTSKLAATLVGFSLADLDGSNVARRIGEWIR